MIQGDTRNALVFFDLCMPQLRETGSNQKHIHLIRERMCQVATTGDVPASPQSASLLARRLLELHVSAIIDLYELHTYERKSFVKLFLDAMVNAPKTLWHPCLVVIDEAHQFCPEKGYWPTRRWNNSDVAPILFRLTLV
jgi:hypothetical protein